MGRGIKQNIYQFDRFYEGMESFHEKKLITDADDFGTINGRWSPREAKPGVSSPQY